LGIESWDDAAVMARSAVQVTMRDKGAVGKDLYTEIENLTAKGDFLYLYDFPKKISDYRQRRKPKTP
jgi:hypothetical protein